MKICVLVLALVIAFSGVAENPLTNGSFEQLGPDDVPVDWEFLGPTVSVIDDARTGSHAVRFVRTPDAPEQIEIGLNRAWQPESGQGGAMLTETSGGFEFWYKAHQIDNAQVIIGAIPMTGEPFESVEAQRSLFTIPEYYADGEWRKGVVLYDYSENPEVEYIHFAVRAMGRTADVVVDDVRWVEEVGAFPELGTLWLDEEPEGGFLYTRLRNIGGQIAHAPEVTATGPDGVLLIPVDLPPDALHPNESRQVSWRVTGDRTGIGEYRVDTTFEAGQAHALLAANPDLVLESFGPIEPFVVTGEPVVLECVVRNEGNAVAERVTVRFAVEGISELQEVTETVQLMPGEKTVFSMKGVPPDSLKPGTILFPTAALHAANVDEHHEARSQLTVVDSGPHPDRVEGPAAEKLAEGVLLKNDQVALGFSITAGRHSVARLWTHRNREWVPAGWLHPSRMVYRDASGKRVERPVGIEPDMVDVTDEGDARSVVFNWEHTDDDDVLWSGQFRFRMTDDAPVIETHYKAWADTNRELLAFDGPMLHVSHRDEALYPGLEWLVDDEISSSTLDIEEGHPHQVRYVVHPHLVTIPAISIVSEHAGSIGLVWDARREWTPEYDRVASVFGSPDRWANQRSHLMGLFTPSVPDYVPVNEREAESSFLLEANTEISISARILADGSKVDSLVATDDYIATHGIPEPEPLPHGNYRSELTFSMLSYLESLWDEETEQWYVTKGGHPLMSYRSRPRAFVADLLLGGLYAEDSDIRNASNARAEKVSEEEGWVPRYDVMKYGERVDQNLLSGVLLPGVLSAWDEDGGRRFDARREGTGVFEGYDYRTLGEHGMESIGLNAAAAYQALRYARIAGDWSVYEAMVPTLEYMKQFRVPRAAQVWEVPVHTPDILAAADAVDAYLEAYRFTGEARWLENAVEWARKGIPFIYLWTASEHSFMLGGSIPVFGATFHTYSWFGQPVQWNGLRYAVSVLRLAEFDDSYPWRLIAEQLLHSAIHQQDLEGDDVALWPDWVNVVTGEKCPWVFGPRQILEVIAILEGRDEEYQTAILGTGRERIHVSAPARLQDAAFDGNEVSVTVTFPEQLQGAVLVSNVTRPDGVTLNGEPLDERTDLEISGDAGWRYAPELAGLTVYVPHDQPATIRIHGIEFYTVERLPLPTDRIDFSFEEGFEGWLPANHIENMTLANGYMQADITGGDPYMIRSSLEVDGDTVSSIFVRMRLTDGTTGQFYWTTQASPGFDESKVVEFHVVTNGAWHDYIIPVGDHPHWKGQEITSIRLDPGNGASRAEVGVDVIRAQE